MKYYIIAGEASGDLHGSRLVKEIFVEDKEAIINAWGGDKMADAGATIVKHYKELAFMGFTEVIKNLGTILANFKFCKNDILNFNPDIVILIDYPGFNLRMAKWVKENNFKCVYYIAPQTWAWKEKRVYDIKKYVDELIVILPFEKEYFEKFGCKVTYVGHPLMEAITEFKKDNEGIKQEQIIALLPGSRKQEILVKLPIMLSVVNHFKDYKFIIVQAPSLDIEFYKPLLLNYSYVQLSNEGAYSILAKSKAALVTSGTATLETALLKIPEIVCYKGGKISYAIAKKLIKIKYISLVNLILDKPLVKELIQNELNTKNLIQQLELLLNNTETKNQILNGYKELTNKLTQTNKPSVLAAKIIVNVK